MKSSLPRLGLAAALLTLASSLAPAAIAQDARPRDTTLQRADTPTAQQARQLQADRQWDAAADAWAALARLDPQNGEAVFNLGYCLHLGGHLEAALEAHQQAAAFERYRALALYNTACAHALLGDPEAALLALAASADAGYPLTNAPSDPDLDSLRADPRFHAILNRPAPGIRGRLNTLVRNAEAIYAHYAPQVRRNIDTMAVAAESRAQSLTNSILQDERFGPIARRIARLVGADQPQPTTQLTPQPTTPADPAPSIATARKLQQAEDWAAAAAAYGAVLARDPQNAAAAFGHAYCLHMSGNFDEAIPAHQQAAAFPEFAGIALYNLGCAYARTGKPDQAFDALQRAHDAGFDLRRYLATDTDLDSLRNDGRYAVLAARINGGL